MRKPAEALLLRSKLLDVEGDRWRDLNQNPRSERLATNNCVSRSADLGGTTLGKIWDGSYSRRIAIGSEGVPESVLGADRPDSTLKDTGPDSPHPEASKSGVR